MPPSTSLRFKLHAEEGELSVEHFETVTETTAALKDDEVRYIQIEVSDICARRRDEMFFFSAGFAP